MIKRNSADTNRELRSITKEKAEVKKWSDIFFNLMLLFALFGVLSWIASHKWFDLAFDGSNLSQDAMRVKAIWNVAMYLLPGSAVLMSLALMVMWLWYEMVNLWYSVSSWSLARKSRGHHEHH